MLKLSENSDIIKAENINLRAEYGEVMNDF